MVSASNSARNILSTHCYYDVPEWADRVAMLDRGAMSDRGLLWQLVVNTGRYDALILNASIGWRGHYVDLVAAAAAARRPGGPVVVLSGCHWKKGGRVARLGRRASVRLMDGPRVTFCVLATDERAVLAGLWGIDPNRVVFTPYRHTLTDQELEMPTSSNGGVLADGDPMRDYGPLIEIAAALPVKVTLASRRLSAKERESLPGNVEAGRQPRRRFLELMAEARAVIVPLAPNIERSAGQQTFLSAMALGKLVIVTDSLGVRDYISHGETGLVVPAGDADALLRAIQWAIDPVNEDAVTRIGERARVLVRANFGRPNYAASLLRVADDALHRH